MKNDVIIVDGFYEKPEQIRAYALERLKNDAYLPYKQPSWIATRFLEWFDCPFKSSESLVSTLDAITGEEVDRDFWKLSYPEHGSKEDREMGLKSCKWNCTFHFKPVVGQQLGNGVHNHVTDIWNRVGNDGWVGLIYLNPNAPIDTGLNLWENIVPERNFDWMTPSENWRRIDSIGAVFNRLILTRGDRPHSGANGFSNEIDQGRVYQTFFFKTKTPRIFPSVTVTPSELQPRLREDVRLSIPKTTKPSE